MKTRRILLMLTLLLSTLIVSAHAVDIPVIPIEKDDTGTAVVVPSEPTENSGSDIAEEATGGSAENAGLDKVAKPSETIENVTSDDEMVKPSEPTPDNEPDDEGSGNVMDSKPFVEIVIDTIYAYRADILSACGAGAFLIYSFLYKKKLVPSVDGLRDKVVATMAGVVGDVQGYIEVFTGKLNTQQETWNKKIDEIVGVVKDFEKVMNETQRQQTEVLALRQELAASDKRNEIYGRIMRAQVEMIHQSLSSACLVEEQHTANHKAYLKQKEMLDALDEELAEKTGAVVEVLEAADDGERNMGGDAQ